MFDKIRSESDFGVEKESIIERDKLDVDEIVNHLKDSSENQWKEDFRSYQRQDQEIFLKAMEEAQEQIIRQVVETLADITKSEYNRVQHKVEESIIETEQDIKTDLTEYQSNIEELKEEINDIRNDLEDTKEELMKEKKARKEDIDELSKKNKDSKSKNEEFESRIAGLEEKLDQKIEEIKELESKNNKNQKSGPDQETSSDSFTKSPDKSKEKFNAGEIDQRHVGKKIKIEGRIVYKKSSSGQNFYKIHSGGSDIVLRSETRVPEGKRTVQGKVEEIKDNLCIVKS